LSKGQEHMHFLTWLTSTFILIFFSSLLCLDTKEPKVKAASNALRWLLCIHLYHPHCCPNEAAKATRNLDYLKYFYPSNKISKVRWSDPLIRRGGKGWFLSLSKCDP
jgi:hypothetical protein